MSFAAFTLAASAARSSKGKEEPQAPPGHRIEAEYSQARDKGVYLMLRPRTRELQVRSRGIVLESVALTDVSFLRYRPALGDAHLEAQLPVLWTVAQDVDISHRKVIAPTELRPYPEEGQEEEEQNTQIAVPPDQGEPLPTPPPSYLIRLDDGWQILVAQEVPARGWKKRILAALQDGWNRLRGEQIETSDLVVLATSPEHAQRIHHLFRAGMQILLDSEAS
ncbi:MAG TPA: hypothetical protein VF017_12965 [Thermoanaerobaculia bacterium]|nr:hypothetical protein [Thermoanaerobaculia bacterium]